MKIKRRIKRGFTLIELMAVVIILGIISTITVVTINFSIKNAKNKLFAEQVNRLQSSVKEWSINNTTLLPTDETGISFFSINRLLEEGIITSEQVIDPRNNEQLQGCLTIKYNEEYSQYVYEYIDEVCDTVVDAYKPTITVIGGLDLTTEVNEIYTFPIVLASDYKNNPVTVEGPIIKRDNTIVSKLDPIAVGDVFTLTYTATDLNMNLTTTKVVNVTVNDTKKPSVCVLYNSETKCESFNITYQSTDAFVSPQAIVTDNSCGISGKETTINNCTTTLIALVSGTVNPLVPGNYDVTYVATDSSGNISNPLIITVTVEDLVPPTIATYDMKLNTSTGSIYNSGWTNQNVWVGNILSTDTGVGVEKFQYSLDCLNAWNDISGSQVYTAEVNTTSYCIRAIDYSGNISGTINKTMKIDKTAPTAGTLTMKLGSSAGSDYTNNTWSNQNVWINESIGSDTLSGHASTAYSVSGATTISSTTIENTLTNDGTSTVTITTTDNAGNTSTRTYTVKIDKVVPTIAFGTNGNSTYAKTYSTTVTSTDATSGVNSSSLEYQWTTSTTAPTEASFSLTFTSGSTISTQAGLNGGYYLWILAKDNAGNTTITRSNVFNLDNTGPVITMNGTTPITLEAGNTYTDAGATSNDAVSGVRTVTTSGSVNPSVPGTYTITYTSSDALGNTSTLTRTVNVVDTTGPTVAFGTNGNSTYAKTYSTTVTVSDNVAVNASSLEYQWTTSTTAPTEASFSLTFTSGSTISTQAGLNGGYYLWILAKDNAGNTTITRSNVFNLDNTGPVITLNGTSPITLEAGTTYTDAGATANDAISGSRTVTTSGSVNPSVPGPYTITYTSSDALGNTSTLTRTVNVVDTTGPTVAFGTNGNSTYAKTYSTTVTISDSVAVNASSLEYQWTTSTTAPTEASFSLTFTSGATINTPAGVTGGYYLWILAKDNIGNTTIARSNVFNLDNTGPVITMNGTSPISIDAGTTYTDAGATANDAISGSRTVTTSGSVNSSVPGTYTITYTATDAAGNTSTLNRTVNVIDIDAPIVTFGTNGNSTYAKSRTTTVNVTDNVSVNSSSLEYQWTTSTTAPTEASFSTTFTNGATINTPAGLTGSYYLWILAKDTTGNTAITRSNVFNIDNINPILAMTGGNTTWKNTSSTITITSSDADSGLSTTQYSTDNINWTNYSTALSYATSTNITLYARATDVAGNTSTTSSTVKIDTAAPTCAVAGGNAAWTTGTRTVTGTCSDTGGSGCIGNISFSYSGDMNISTAGAAGNGVGGSVSDNAGNTTSCAADQIVKIDATAPVCTGITLSGTYGQAGWYRSTVSGTVAGASDATSGVATITNPTSVSGNTANNGVTMTGSVTDNAGNSTSCTSSGFGIDATAPVFYAGSYNQTSWYKTFGSNIGGCGDALSGLTTCRYSWSTSTTTPTGMTSACTGGTDVPVTDGASSIYTTAGTGRPTTTGTYYLHMCAIDQAGVGSSYRLTRLMDTTAPTMPTPVCAYRFEAGYDAYVYYYSIGADAHSGLASGNLSSDLGSMSTTTVWASGTYAGRLRAMKVGTLTLDTAQMISSVSMLDAVGNTYSGGTSTWSITCSACVTGTTCP